MSEQIRKRLDDVIESDILNLGTLEIGSEKRGSAVDDLAKLYKLRIEETKNEMELRERREARFMESEAAETNKQAQLSEQVKDRYFRVGIAVAEIFVPIGFYALWMKRGFKFEETGTYTSKTFMNLINRFKPTKK